MSGGEDVGALVDWVDDIATDVSGQAHGRWAMVTSTDPLLVRLDGDPGPILGTPDTLVAGLAVGDRVRVSIENRRPLILGRAGGPDIVRVISPGQTVWGVTGSQTIVTGRSVIGTTDASGNYRVTHGLGLVGVGTITVISGDSGAEDGAISIRGGSFSDNVNADSFVVHTPHASRETRFNYILIGWQA